MELNYGFGRMAPQAGVAGPGGHAVGALEGTIDWYKPASGVVHGWAVDRALAKGGVAPVTVIASVDASDVAATLASESRPDLVRAGVAPNAEHGFSLTLPAEAREALLGKGRHVLDVRIVGSPGTVVPRSLTEKSQVVCVDGVCK